MLEPKTVMEKDAQGFPGLAKKGQVLVINDNKAVREALSRKLRFSGLNVTIAGNGFEGGILFCNRSYDLVIIDLQIPQMNVWELSRIFKERYPKTPVLMVSALSDDKRWGNFDSNGVDAIILKPFKLAEIEETVQRLLRRRTQGERISGHLDGIVSA